MRRRLLGGQKQQSANKGLLLPLSAIPSSSSNRSGAGGLQNELPSSASSSPPSATLLAYRRSFTAADGPAGSGRAAADYSGFLAENKYATIGGHRSKWPPPPPPPPLRAGDEKALNGAGGGGGRPLGRPRSMGAAQMGVKCCGSGGGGGDDNNGGDGQREEAETAFGGMGCLRDLPPPPPLPPHAGANLLMTAGDAKQLHSTTAAQQQQQMGQGAPPPPALPMMFQQQPSSHHQQQNNNRNSTGSTNSSQTTSSGFESAKSASSQQLAQSSSSGSCSSSSALQHSTATSVINTTLPATTAAIGSPADPASPSSRLSSAGSSTQGGRSSAYFSLSDGLDSSQGAGGTLTSGSQQRRATNQHGRRGQNQLQQQQQCPRVNIGEMMAKGIPEPEIFAEWLQRLCLSDYLALFLAQGYDLPTLARATPEDLTTLGITRPEDRKRLSQDIQCWRNVGDQWPTDMAREAPVRDWLAAVGLKQYAEQFEQQGYLSVGELEQLEADDLEDLGVRKLGHIKRLWLALKKLKQAQIRRVDQQMAAAAQQSATAILSPPSILRPCSLASSSSNTASSSSSSNMATLRRHSQPQQPQQQQQQQTPLADEVPHMREAQAQQQQSQANDHHVQFRNSSFGIEVGREEGQPPDKGPPRLNLYRTSQIIAQLPREPPPEFPDDDLPSSAYGSHIPPPPAPMPLSPGQFASSRPALHFASLSQPATPRNVQKLFALPAYGIGGGSFQQHQQQHFPLGQQQQQQQQHDQQQGRLQLDQILQGLNGQRLDDGFYSARGTMGRR